jgi:hypothetical protein
MSPELLRLGHWRPFFAAMQNAFPARQCGKDFVLSLEEEADETTGVHHSTRRHGGGVAGGGAGAAAGDAGDRVPQLPVA